jgi:hypothetical protein
MMSRSPEARTSLRSDIGAEISDNLHPNITDNYPRNKAIPDKDRKANSP